MSTVGLDLYSFADLRRLGALAEIGRAFDLDPNLRPERMDIRDPLRTRIASAEGYLANAEGLVETDDLLFERRNGPHLSGALSGLSYRLDESRDAPHRLYAGTDDVDEQWLGNPEHLEAFAQLFVRLAGAFEATYGFVADDR